VEDTRALSNDLKVRIKNLEKKGGTGRDAAVRKSQVRIP
jgi:syntaxin 1B/2/3